MPYRLFLPLLILAATPALAQRPDEAAERQRSVEAGLLPAVLVAGAPQPTYSVTDRMAHYGVPAVSVAVINDGRIEWARGYGVREAGGSVTTATLFQAASISKPITATAALRLVEAGRLDLDGDVNDRLRSWHVPESAYTAEHPVTLRGLLSHTAGLTVSGFPGYAAGEAVPTLVGVLDGEGNTDPVRVDTTPGTAARYSGGGFAVAQLLVEDVTGEPFAAVVGRTVLDPLGMERSTFAQPLPDALGGEAAVAHDEGGAPVAGRWHTYPERAAAGLWTTPTDLARFLLGLRAAWLGEPGAILSPEMTREMFTRGMVSYGLGIGVDNAGDSLRVGHNGANWGYRAVMVLYPATGDGAVVMTNADAGGEIRYEILRAISQAYGWPDFKPDAREVVTLGGGAAERLVGAYRFVEDPARVLVVDFDGDHFTVRHPSEAPQRLWPVSETSFFVEGEGTSVVFAPGGAEGEMEWNGEERARRVR